MGSGLEFGARTCREAVYDLPRSHSPAEARKGKGGGGSDPHHQHSCTGCHTTLLPRAGNGIRQAMGARSRGLCGQTLAVAACQYASEDRSTLVRERVVAEIASPTLPFDAS
eukprot:2443539-Prymnesium_polylepis.1